MQYLFNIQWHKNIIITFIQPIKRWTACENFDLPEPYTVYIVTEIPTFGVAHFFFVFKVVGLPRRWRNTLFRNVHKCISINMMAHRRRRKFSTNYVLVSESVTQPPPIDLPSPLAGRSIFSTSRVARSTHSNVTDRQGFSFAHRVLVKWKDFGFFTLWNTGLIQAFWSKALPPTSEWTDFFS